MTLKAKMSSTMKLGFKGRLVNQAARPLSRLGFSRAYGFFRSCLVERQVAIIAYHRVGRVSDYPWSLAPVSPRDFERQVRYLRRKYRIISLEELSASLGDLKAMPPKTAVITFDDGYKDVYLNAYPVLKSYNMPATLFLTTGNIGTGDLFWWDKIGYVVWKTKLNELDLGELGIYHLDSDSSRLQASTIIEKKLKNIPDEKRGESIETLMRRSGIDIPANLGKELILSWDEVKEMAGNGISFGAHTVHHPILTRLPLEAARREIVDSKKKIEKELGREVTTFCYPNGEPGDYNSDIQEILKSSGFRCAVTFKPAAFVSKTALPFQLPRITGTSSYDLFELAMSGLYTDLAAVRDRFTGTK